MDASRSSSVNKALGSTETLASPEESGWTTYFEDFFETQKREEAGGNCPMYPSCSAEKGHGGSSMISDASSGAAWKLRAATGASEINKKLSFKKRKSQQAVGDDPLEDTASSPVNSPKVLQEMGAGCEKFKELRREEMDELGLIDQNVNECMDLTKKGLCLVPLSMFVDYQE